MKATFGEITCDTETAERIATWCVPLMFSPVDAPQAFSHSESVFKTEAGVYFMYTTWTTHHTHGKAITLLIPKEVENWFDKRGIFNFKQQDAKIEVNH